jgi:hypothetical protein
MLVFCSRVADVAPSGSWSEALLSNDDVELILCVCGILLEKGFCVLTVRFFLTN